MISGAFRFRSLLFIPTLCCYYEAGVSASEMPIGGVRDSSSAFVFWLNFEAAKDMLGAPRRNVLKAERSSIRCSAKNDAIFKVHCYILLTSSFVCIKIYRGTCLIGEKSCKLNYMFPYPTIPSNNVFRKYIWNSLGNFLQSYFCDSFKIFELSPKRYLRFVGMSRKLFKRPHWISFCLEKIGLKIFSKWIFLRNSPRIQLSLIFPTNIGISTIYLPSHTSTKSLSFTTTFSPVEYLKNCNYLI